MQAVWVLQPPRSRAVGRQVTLENPSLPEESTGDRGSGEKAGSARGLAGRVYAFVGAISNYSVFESHHFLDSANQRYFCPRGQNTSFYFLLHN